jgi:uncharacterized protein (DUF2141 family)
MNRHKKIVIIIACLLAKLPTYACSAFFYSEQPMLFARNFDWYSGNGYLIKNNRGVEKYAYAISQTQVAHWTSKFGSFTFNQIGKEFPYGGINEKGLVVEQLWLHGSTYKTNPNAAVISELEWIQYQLDNYENVPEVIAHLNDLSIKPIKASIHYFVADRLGHSATIDFLGGQVFVNQKDGRYQVLTNTAYQAADEYFQKNGKAVDVNSRMSEDRYCHLRNHLQSQLPQNHLDALQILSQAAEFSANYKTFWSIVYDLSAMKIHFKTFANAKVKTLAIGGVDYSPNSPILGCDLNNDQLNLEPYTYDLNKALMNSSLKAMDILMNEDMVAAHQYNPSNKRTDPTFMANYATIKIQFKLKKPGGSLYYTIAQGESNFNARRGVVSTMLPADTTIIYTEAYALKKGEYGIACFHDTNGNKKLDAGLWGIPKEPYAFYQTKKGLFGLPPKYRRIKFQVDGDQYLQIEF